jgi:hypothetical protein
MANGNLHVHTVDTDTLAGGLTLICPGGLPALAGTRGRRFASRKARNRTLVSAALNRTEDRIVSVRRSR